LRGSCASKEQYHFPSTGKRPQAPTSLGEGEMADVISLQEATPGFKLQGFNFQLFLEAFNVVN
jgi:hypothetical protein